MTRNRFLLLLFAVTVFAGCGTLKPAGLEEDGWPNNPCPPSEPVGGTTVEMKLDEIIGFATGSPDPIAQWCSDKAMELKTFQPADPIGGSTHVNNAANAADPTKGQPPMQDWNLCKAELEQVN